MREFKWKQKEINKTLNLKLNISSKDKTGKRVKSNKRERERERNEGCACISQTQYAQTQLMINGAIYYNIYLPIYFFATIIYLSTYLPVSIAYFPNNFLCFRLKNLI